MELEVDSPCAAPAPPKEASETPTGGHLPVLDGLRGLAILLVLADHTFNLKGSPFDHWAEFLPSVGWSGVYLFFVLSGFLITGMLWEAKSHRNYFRNFYARRFLRIYPIYYAVLVGIFVVGNLVPALAPASGANREHQVWFWLYLSNYLMAHRAAFAPAPLGVTWSLAVEEQFYFVWPFLVLLFSRRTLIRICVALIVLCFLVRTGLVLGSVNPRTVYFLPFSQLDALAAGAGVALALRGPQGLAALRPLAGWGMAAGSAALLLIALRTQLFDFVDPLMQTVGYTAFTVLFASMLVAAVEARPGRLYRRFLESRVMRAYGRYSYGLYLLHEPVIGYLVAAGVTIALLPPLLGSHLPGQLLYSAAVLGTATLVAVASWHLYERRFLDLKRFFPYWSPTPRTAP